MLRFRALRWRDISALSLSFCATVRIFELGLGGRGMSSTTKRRSSSATRISFRLVLLLVSLPRAVADISDTGSFPPAAPFDFLLGWMGGKFDESALEETDKREGPERLARLGL